MECITGVVRKVAPLRSEDLDGGMDDATRSHLDLAGDWPMIEAQLPPNWRELAAIHGVSPKRQQAQLGTKVTDVVVPLRMVLHHVATNMSLKTTAAIAAAAGLIDISAVALHLWMRRFGPFLTALLAALTHVARDFTAARWAGYELVVVDASTVRARAARARRRASTTRCG